MSVPIMSIISLSLVPIIRHYSKTDGSSVCPIDYRVPTADELLRKLRDENDKYFFKLGIAGFREQILGRLISGQAYLWSSETRGGVDSALAFYISTEKYFASKIFDNEGRSAGHSIRCIKD